MHAGDSRAEIDRRRSAFSRRASEAGIVLDFDGTLSDIVSRPELARLRDGAARELARLVRAYALVAVVSGRPPDELPRLVGVEGIVYVGSYGMQEIVPLADEVLSAVETLARSVPGAWVERKGATATVHVRQTSDPDGATTQIGGPLRDLASAWGLEVIEGKRALEVVPAGRPRKGGAVERLVEEYGLAAVLYAGDDTADVEAFAALDALEDRGVLGLRVAVWGSEMPDDLVRRSDLSVEGPAGLVELLREL